MAMVIENGHINVNTGKQVNEIEFTDKPMFYKSLLSPLQFDGEKGYLANK